MKYDREPSKSTWQADGQIQDFTSDEKNEPCAAQTEVHFSFWLVTLMVGGTDGQTEQGFYSEMTRKVSKRGFK